MISYISFSFFFFFFICFPVIAHGDGGVCGEEVFCSPEGPAVRFPFRLVGKQPEYCGYNASYNLRCDKLNRTILELPSSSATVFVTNISYVSQRIQVNSSETCFAKQLKDLDISATPFRYYFPDPGNWITDLIRYSLFNCSGEEYTSFDGLQCLKTNGYYVDPKSSDESLVGYMGRTGRLTSACTKMYDTKFIPPQLLGDGDYAMQLILNWSVPNCRGCEETGGVCGWRNRHNNKLSCFRGTITQSESGILKIISVSGPIIGCFLLIPAVGAIFFLHSKKQQQKANQMKIKTFLEDYAAMKPTRYSYADLKSITNNFKDKLGEGAYGIVFKGRISHRLFVAVKLLHSNTGNGDEFINEVGTIATIHHVNVVRLVGFCADGYKRVLVFEFLPNGSLDKFIFPDGQVEQQCHTLPMRKLHDIAVAIARGIEYLHQGCQQRILHFDIKPHNILLDENYNPKISDFGLAKLCEKGKSAVSMTAARGTMGYIAPEVFSREFGNVSYKCDVYSYGMLFLEMVGRRNNIDTTVKDTRQVYLPEWLYENLVNGEELRIQFEEEGDDVITRRLAIVGLWCIQWNPVDRPSITSVLQMLEGNGDDLRLPSNPFTSRNVTIRSDQITPFTTKLIGISESE